MSARIFTRLVPLLLLARVMTAAVLADEPFAFDSAPGKLPKTVVPRLYSIRLESDLEQLTTHGMMTVEIEVRELVAEIVLNARDLEITDASLVSPGQLPLEIVPNADAQIVTLKPPRAIKPGKYRLMMEFRGKISEQCQGLFYAKYATASGKKIMLATEMEPADARRMFPCWDEPAFRASYELTVVVPKKHLAVSNMPIEKETPLAGGMKEVEFKRTPPMASYLVVLVSGELEELQGAAEGVKLRVITTEGKREQGRYALDAAKRLLAYYNNYFGIKYPLPKLDLIAVPGGFDGAMENWGGIVFNESMLLYDPASSSEQTKRDIFVTVAHEMSHQWFGDLVTMGWWDNLWLNEGFASWMETKATGHFNPDWGMWLTAGVDKSGVMSDDARQSTHAIQSAVDNESEANDAFDNITYLKGEAFLRMLENYLGEAVFRKGLHRYLAAHQYGNTTTADLWNALEKASGKPIRAMAAGWVEQPGLPVVNATGECVDGKEKVTLTAERFKVDYDDAEPLHWMIPVAWMDVGHPGAVKYALLYTNPVSITLPDCDTAIKLNAGDVGYYRVDYDAGLFAKLKRDIGKLPAADRLNVLNDTWAMVEANRASSTNFLALAESLQHDGTYAIWQQIISVLELADELEQGQPGWERLREYARWLLGAPMQRLGWDARHGEPPDDALLRNRVIGALGRFGDQAVIAEAQARFAGFLARPDSLPADLRPCVLHLAGRYADRKTFDQLRELARHATGTEERELYLDSLAGALEDGLAREALEISLGDDEPAPQEAAGLVAEVAVRGGHTELAWDFAREHFKALIAKVDAVNQDNYLPSILGASSDTARAGELMAFVKANQGGGAEAMAEEGAGEIRFRAGLKRRELPEIDRWTETRTAGR